MAEPPRRRPSLTEIAGPDRRVSQPDEDSTARYERLLREAHEEKKRAKLELIDQAVQADEKLAELENANRELLRRLAEHVRQKSTAPPAVPPPAAKTTPHWLTLTLALVAALGGGGAGAGITKAVSNDKAADMQPELDKIRDRVYAGERADARRTEYLRDRQEPEELRWRLMISWTCAVNAHTAFARGVNCNDGIVWTTPPVRPKYFRTEETWPRMNPAP